jgi:dTDP-4-dehydrorhamnose reductase
MKSVLVLGGTGMLGSMVVDELARRPAMRVFSTYRAPSTIPKRDLIPGVVWLPFDAESSRLDEALVNSAHIDWIINAIGITKPLIRDDDSRQVERAIRVNALLPLEVARYAEAHGSRVLQIATDCVYSGAEGSYLETASHDALDVYGKTKSLGECHSPNVAHLRCSIIGPEPKDFKFLIAWFRSQPDGGNINGFVNHQWNGVTTLHFARICAGIIETEIQLPHLQHIIPQGAISKAEMLHEFASAYRRADVKINDVEAPKVIDRTLATSDPELNRQLWRAAGYQNAPTVPEMIAEVANYPYRFSPQEVA